MSAGSLTATREDFTVPPDDPDRFLPLDLRGGGVRIWFTAKYKIGDSYASAALKLGNDNAGLSGIVVDAADPGNIAEISLTSEQTAALEAPKRLIYDVKADIAGSVSVLEEGTLLVKRTVSDLP
jgi:hypothetical protein